MCEEDISDRISRLLARPMPRRKALAGLFSLLLLPLTAHGSPSDNNKSATKEPLTFYLNSEVHTLNAYYTIEYYEANGPALAPLGSAQIGPKPVSNVVQLVTYLRKQLPQAEVSIDSIHPKVIRIIDKNLTSKEDYGLNKPVILSYSGLLCDLPKAIGNATDEDVSFLNTNDAALISIYPEMTEVNLDLNYTSGREMLISAVYRPGCSHELWEACTSLRDGRNHTMIDFPPPVP